MVTTPANESPGFQGLLSLAQWTNLIRNGARGTHERGDFLLRQGEPGGIVRMLAAGRVKVVYIGDDGSEALLCVRGPGEVLGEFADFETERMATVQAIESCVSHSMTVATFRRYLCSNGIEQTFQRYAMDKMRQTGPQQWFTACGGIDSRLAYLLLSVMRVAGPGHRNPSFVPLSQDELASALGVARSSITPWIKRWKEVGVVTVTRGGVVLRDVSALRKAVHTYRM